MNYSRRDHEFKLWFLFLKNMLNIGATMLFSNAILITILSMLTQLSLVDALLLSLNISLVFFVAGFFLYYLNARSRAGSVRVDVGRHPQWWVFALCAAAAAFTDLIDYSQPSSSPNPTGQFSPYLDLLSITFLASFAFGRLQLCENGIWDYWGLARWQDISTYVWKDDTKLILIKRGWFSVFRGELTVPLEYGAAFEEQLSQHIVSTK